MKRSDRFMVGRGSGAFIADLGLDRERVLRRASLPLDTFIGDPKPVSPAEYYALWRAIEEECGDPNIPIRVVRALSVEVFEPAMFAALCSPNLNIAADRIAKYKRLIGPLRMSIDRGPDETTLRFAWPAGVAPPPSLVLTELLFWVALTRLATRSEVRPTEVTTPHPPADARAYRQYLGVAIQSGPEHSVTFSASDATRPFLIGDEGMWAFFEPSLRLRLADLDAQPSTEQRVRSALLELLPVGSTTIEAVSRSLGVSNRTLQRHLKDEGTSFQQILNRTREDLARHYLVDSDLPAAEISFLIGYEDPSSFYRAFHEWTGETPQRVRSGAA